MTRRYNTIIAENQQDYSYFGKPIPNLKGAACYTSGVDPEIYFPYPRRHNRKELKLVRAVCNSCPVKIECLEYALKNDEQWGVWGGLTPKQRTMLKKSRKRDAQVNTALVGGKFSTPNWRGTQASSESA